MVPGGSYLSDAEDRGMSDMISVLHQSVTINAKGGYFLLRLVAIDVNP